MNPFDWRGPEFLMFYIVLIAAVLAWCWYRVRYEENPTTVPRVSDLINDPYSIAYLRGGAVETIRIAVFNLLDRGFLAFAKDKLAAERADANLLRRPLDSALLRACGKPQTLAQLAGDVVLQQSCRNYAEELERRGLLLDPARRSMRTVTRLVAMGVVLGVAAVKLVLAAQRGHANVGFLMMLAALAFYGVIIVCGISQRTPLGERALANIRELSGRLRQRAAELRPGGASTDALLLAGVFGVAALPADAFPLVPKVYPKASSGGGNSCGSSCSSSSCGGGGCGGGCGGCGG